MNKILLSSIFALTMYSTNLKAQGMNELSVGLGVLTPKFTSLDGYSINLGYEFHLDQVENLSVGIDLDSLFEAFGDIANTRFDHLAIGIKYYIPANDMVLPFVALGLGAGMATGSSPLGIGTDKWVFPTIKAGLGAKYMASDTVNVGLNIDTLFEKTTYHYVNAGLSVGFAF